jgi:hypothetical protein
VQQPHVGLLEHGGLPDDAARAKRDVLDRRHELPVRRWQLHVRLARLDVRPRRDGPAATDD